MAIKITQTVLNNGELSILLGVNNKMMVKLYLKVIILLIFTIPQQVFGQWNLLGNGVYADSSEDFFSYSVSISKDGSTIASGSPNNDYNGINTGYVKVYSLISNDWIQKGNTIYGDVPGDSSGASVSLSHNGNLVAIGSPKNSFNDYHSGLVRVFEWDGSIWAQKGNDIEGLGNGSQFGRSTSFSFSGDVLAIGAPNKSDNGTDIGSVQIFEWNGVSWVQIGASIYGENIGDLSGSSVDLNNDGTSVIIGAPFNDANGDNTGHARVYAWNGSTWEQKGSDLDGEDEWDLAGIATAISDDGNIVAVGAPQTYIGSWSNGQVVVYEWNGIDWQQMGPDIEADMDEEYFGRSIDLSQDGQTIVVGAPQSDGFGNQSGIVQAYFWNDSVWSPKNGPMIGEYHSRVFGHSVSIAANGERVVVGDIHNDSIGLYGGSAHVYSYTCLNSYHSYNDFGCNSFISPSGKVWTTPNIYQDTITNLSGCDSVLTINVSIHDSITTSNINAEECFFYTSPSGKTWDSSGIYLDTVINMFGCDSIMTINLTVTTIDTSITMSGQTLTANHTNANYQWLYCWNMAAVSGETNQSYTPDIDWDFAVRIEENNCVDTSSCYTVEGTYLKELEIEFFTVFPVPAKNSLNIIFLKTVPDDAMIYLYNSIGEIVKSYNVVETNNLDLKGITKGIYFVQLIYSERKSTPVKIVIE